MQAYPRPEFQWWFGDEAIQSLDKYDDTYDVNTTVSNNDVYQSFLRIADINEADYGEYTCKSWNHRGENSARFQLQDTSAPEAPTNLRLVNTSTLCQHLNMKLLICSIRSIDETNRSRLDLIRSFWNGKKVSMEATSTPSTASRTAQPTTSSKKTIASTRILAPSEDCNSSNPTSSR